MQDSRIKELEALQRSPLALSKELDEFARIGHPPPLTREKQLRGEPVIPHYTAIHREDLGQGRSRSYTVSHQFNPNGEMQIVGVSVTDA